MRNEGMDSLAEDEIAELCMESARLVGLVQRHVGHGPLAWMVAQELLRRSPPVKGREVALNGPAMEGQLAFLRSLGIRSLKDLSWHQASVLTDCVLAEGRAEDLR